MDGLHINQADCPTPAQLKSFAARPDKSPLAAQFLLYENSPHSAFLGLANLGQDGGTENEAIIEQLIKEIEGNETTDEDLVRITTSYHEARNNELSLHMCACCGVRDSRRSYELGIDISTLELLEMSTNFKNTIYEELGEYKDIASVFISASN